MKSRFGGGLLALLTCAALCSCAVEYSEPVWVKAPLRQDAVPQDSEGKLKVDDVVRIQVESQVYEYKVLKLDETGFVGEGEDGSHPVEFSSVGKMWVKRWRRQVERARP